MALHDPEIALLRTFLTLSGTRNFTRTGEIIGRSQSAVSGQMHKLEALLGRELLERDTRNVRLTADGEKLLAHARRLVSEADALLERFRVPEVTGEVRFGSPEDFASVYLPGVLAAFARAHPGVALFVSCRLTLHLLEDLRAGERDLIVVKQDPDRPFEGARPLFRERLVWVTGGALAEAGPVPLVLSPAPCVYRSLATAALDRAGRPWRVVYTSPSVAGATAAVRAGLGMTVLPRTMVPPDLAALAPDKGWPVLPDAEMALLSAPRPPPAVAALAAFIAERTPAQDGRSA